MEPRVRRRRSAARTASSAGARSAPEIRLQQMRQRVHVAQLAILHAEEVSIGRAAAGCVAGPESAERHDRTGRRVHDEAAVGNIHTTRDADLAGVLRDSFAGVRAAFRAIAGETPRHQVHLPF